MDVNSTDAYLPPEAERLRKLLAGADGRVVPENLPFTPRDATVGLENEMQAAVVGSAEEVDLPISLIESGFYRNLRRRTASGDAPREVLARLENYLEHCGNVWPNSRVRIPVRALSEAAMKLVESDMRSDKNDLSSPPRSDRADFFAESDGETFLRVPVSYLLKISLFEALHSAGVPAELRERFPSFQRALICDNTSPELLSFFPLKAENSRHGGNADGVGKSEEKTASSEEKPERGNAHAETFSGKLSARPISIAAGSVLPAAQETAIRLALCQLLIFYANSALKLRENGQRAVLYMSPHVPVAQQEINALIPDAFYRDLFMNPCLNGWARGEDKMRYMRLCHEVLSRSYLNILSKLKNAGIITRNLVVLPNTSNASLATNGTHITTASRILTRAASSGALSPEAEKFYGDLVSKAMEHFLPLFVGQYTAAPFRLSFENFHPEKALGFLAHELDFTHLRMIWRRWKKKAQLNVFGWRLTPFGPAEIDALIAKIFRLKGDFIPDFRLIDYFMTLLSTDESPCLDGVPGNTDRLKKDLCAMGIFDPAMSVYTLFRQREFKKYGFCGFEGRFFSLFPRLGSDISDAVRLQCTLTAAVYKMIATGTLRRDDIPDTPDVESERRQIFFDRAIGLATFYVRENSENRFLMRILDFAKNTRRSHRYPGFIRVKTREYCLAVLDFLFSEARDVIEYCDAESTLDSLRLHLLEKDEDSAAGTLSRQVCRRLRVKTPLSVPADTFNRAAENYYREELRRAHFLEGIAAAEQILGDEAGKDFVASAERAFDEKSSSAAELRTLIAKMLRAIVRLGDAEGIRGEKDFSDEEEKRKNDKAKTGVPVVVLPGDTVPAPFANRDMFFSKTSVFPL